MKQQSTLSNSPVSGADLIEKIEYIEQIWDKLCFVNWSNGAFKSIRRVLLSMIGEEDSLDNNLTSHIANSFVIFMDEIIKTKQVPAEDQRYFISQLIYTLRKAATGLTSETTNVDADDICTGELDKINQRLNKLVYIVDDDCALAEYIAVQIKASGYRVRVFNCPDDMFLAIEEDKPAVIIMDVVFPEGNFTGIKAVKHLVEKTDIQTSIVLMSGRTDMSARIQAIRAGSEAYFTKPIDVQEIISKLDDLVLKRSNSHYKVLVVNDDRVLAEICSNALLLEGIEVQIIEQPLQIMQSIRKFVPDLILVDTELNDCKGTELIAIIRQETDMVNLPVLYLTDDLNPRTLQASLTQEGDEYLTKPLIEDDLVYAVKHKIDKARRFSDRYSQGKKPEVLAGLIDRKKFLAEIELLALSVTRHENQRAVLWIEIDQLEYLLREFDVINPDFVFRQITYAILSCLTGNELISRFSNSAFSVLTIPTAQQDLNELALKISRKIDNLPVTILDGEYNLKCNIGIAYVEPGTKDGRKLLADAENACIKSMSSKVRKVVNISASNKMQINLPKLRDVNSSQLTSIEKSLRNKNFCLMFQPILSIGEKKEELYEVFVRMQGEDEKLISPAEFLPVAAEKGLLCEIDRWVIDHAINKLSDDLHARSHSNLFIKLSSDSLNDKMLVTWISNCMKNSRIRGQQRLYFELSEQTVSENFIKAHHFAQSVRNLGCGIVIDHYGGTDHSIKILNDLQVDFVKIHSASVNEIVADMEERARYKVLVESAMEQCNDVIIGAVENPYNLSLLWEWGVRYVQGYFIQPPQADLEFDFENTVTFK